MKIVATHDIISNGAFVNSKDWEIACKQVNNAIIATDWPHGSGTFTIYPQSGKKRDEGNGVKPIKIPCIKYLELNNWEIENYPDISGGILRTGDLDAIIETKSGIIGFEWETGNISSSHRAINKLLLTLKLKGIIGGFLVVPSDEFKKYLTDRIGNIGELKPYFPLWKSFNIRNGALRIMVVEHDKTSKKVPKIPKGTDGRAKN